MAVVESALRGAALRPGFRVARFSVQGNHVHLVVEAATAAGLTSGMKALAIRLARGMNRLMGRRGPVLEDRFHAHVLRTPIEVRRALAYVAGNFASHARRREEAIPDGFRDPFGSGERADLVGRPTSWLLRRAMTSAESSDGE
jgi:hypothetical protein